MPYLLRAVFAVMAGFVVMMLSVVVLTLIFVKTMGLKSGYPTPGYLAVNALYSFLAAAIGGYVAAAIDKVKPIQTASILALLMLVMGIVSYRHYTGLQPLWYQFTMMAVPPLCAIAGSALYARNAPAIRP